MRLPTPTAATSASPPPRGGRGTATTTGEGRFPLATLVARTMLAVFLVFMLLTAIPWFFTRGPDVGLGVLASALPNIAILVAFAVFLPKGNLFLAAAFALWCAWGLVDSFSGASGTFVAIVGYALGVLNFVGFVGVVKGWPGKATP